jgi:hypothetical protein
VRMVETNCLLSENLMETGFSEDKLINWRIILKCIFTKECGRVWTGFAVTNPLVSLKARISSLSQWLLITIIT